MTLAGLAVEPDAALRTDVRAVNQPASPAHPWGTDALGRDQRARVLRGGLATLGVVVLASIAVFVPAALGGAVTGSLASSPEPGTRSLADYLLLPADTLLYLPAVPGVMVLAQLLRGAPGSPPANWLLLGLACAIVLLPRAVRVLQKLWMAASGAEKSQSLIVAAMGALFLGTLFAGLGLVASVDFLGGGTLPPTPSLGTVMRDSMQMRRLGASGMLAPLALLWLCSFAFYTAADALVGFFPTKEPLTHLNA
jgi:peptide/nickel transport system permease protein